MKEIDLKKYFCHWISKFYIGGNCGKIFFSTKNT